MKTFKYNIKAAINNNLRLIFILKSKRERERENEINFIKTYLDKKEVEFFMNNILQEDGENYKSYFAIEKSKVVTALYSTMLYEKLALDGKFLACNFTDEESFNFSLDCFFRLIKPSYEEFENRLLKIIDFQDENYFNKIKGKLISSNKELTHKVINSKLKDLLNENKNNEK